MKMCLLHVSLGLGITTLLLVLLLRIVDVRDIVSAFGRADLRLVPIAISMHIGAMWLRSLVWRRLLPSRPSTRTLFQISIVGFAVNYLMPVRIGELVRVYLVKRWCKDESGPILASLVAERVLDGLTVSSILLVALLFVPAPAYVVALGITIAAAFAALGLILALVSWRTDVVVALAGLGVRPLPPSLRPRLIHLAHGFAGNLGQLGGWRSVPPLVVLVFSGWLAQFAVFYVLMFAFPLTASLPEAMLDGSIANFATLLPSAPGAVGAFDAALINLLMDIQGASVENAAAYALLVHAVLILPIVALGGLILWRTDLSLRQLVWPTRKAASTTASTVSQLLLNGNGFVERQNANHVVDGHIARRHSGELQTR
jgi:uncharacterized protein (TIRG00374 family)